MFCPKCGNQVPDGAAFCGKCGNKFTQAAVSSASNNASTAVAAPQAGGAIVSPAVGGGMRLTAVGIVSVVLAILAMVITLVPWFELSSNMNAVSGFASGMASFLGASDGYLAFQDSYSVFTLVGLAKTFGEYVSVASSFGSSSGSGAAVLIYLFAWACLLLWVVALALTIWGSVSGFARGSIGLLRVGNIIIIAMVAVFYFFTAAMGSDTGSVTLMPLLCLILAIASLVCTFMAKKA